MDENQKSPGHARNEAERMKNYREIGNMEESWRLFKTPRNLYHLAKNYRRGNREVTYTIRDNSSNLLIKPEDVTRRWNEYFEEPLNVGERQRTRDAPNDIPKESEFITVDELRIVLSQLRRICG